MFRPKNTLAALALALASLAPVGAWADAPEKTAAAAASGDDVLLEKEVERLYLDGKYDAALAAAERLVQKREEAYGKEDPRTASALSDLGAMKLAMGDYPAAEPLLRRAVSILETAKGADERLSPALSNLGALLKKKGETKNAEALFLRVIALEEKGGAARETELGDALKSLASLYGEKRSRPKAIELVKRAVALHQKPGAERALISDLSVLGQLLRMDGHYPEADVELRRALAIAERVNGPNHPETGKLLLQFAILWTGGAIASDNGVHANEYFGRAEATLSAALGPMHPDLAQLYEEWAVSRTRVGDRRRALELWEKAQAVEEAHFANVLAAGTEEDKIAYATQMERSIDRAISFQTFLGGQEQRDITRFVLRTILRNKGRVLDATAAGISALRSRMSPEDQALLDELARVRRKLSTLIVEGPRGKTVGELIEQSKVLGDEADRIEAKISERSAPYRLARTPITIEAVQARIPEDAALIEFVRYKPRDAHFYSAESETERAEMYFAYLLRHEGEPRCIQVGVTGDQMDDKARIIRKAAQDPNNFKFEQQLGLLHHSTFGRLLYDLKGIHHLILSPDSTMSLMPLATAVSPKQRFLIEDYVLTYVSSGRDLLRFGEDRPPPRSGPVVFANPDYDAPGEPGKTAAVPIAKDALPMLSRLHFNPLPGTAEEAAAIRHILPAPFVRLREEASEGALLHVAGPKILHIATHGFFLSEEGVPQKGNKRGLELDTAAPLPGPLTDDGRRMRVINPMFRSAIALAGANVRKGQADDGILTAYEVSALDLSGTELVVLSACETGLGSLVAREGVQGLRRALVVAGAETQVMSLWQVDDAATRDLMVAFYDKLYHKGLGRGEAMREAQVEMLHTKGREHPFYWASFIVSGAWGPLASTGPGSVTQEAPGEPKAAVPPGGARGCGCVAAGAEDGPVGPGAAGLAFFFALALAGRSRRGPSLC